MPGKPGLHCCHLNSSSCLLLTKWMMGVQDGSMFKAQVEFFPYFYIICKVRHQASDSRLAFSSLRLPVTGYSRGCERNDKPKACIADCYSFLHTGSATQMTIFPAKKCTHETSLAFKASLFRKGRSGRWMHI